MAPAPDSPAPEEAAAPSFSDNVTHLHYKPGLHENLPEEQAKDIYIVGTAHISKRSVEEVREVIRAVLVSSRR